MALSLLNTAYLRTHSDRSVYCSTRMVGRSKGSVESKGMVNMKKKIEIALVMDLFSRFLKQNIEHTIYPDVNEYFFFVCKYMYIKFWDITYGIAVLT